MGDVVRVVMFSCDLDPEVLYVRLVGLESRFTSQPSEADKDASLKYQPFVSHSQRFTNMKHKRNAAFRWSLVKGHVRIYE